MLRALARAVCLDNSSFHLSADQSGTILGVGQRAVRMAIRNLLTTASQHAIVRHRAGWIRRVQNDAYINGFPFPRVLTKLPRYILESHFILLFVIDHYFI